MRKRTINCNLTVHRQKVGIICRILYFESILALINKKTVSRSGELGRRKRKERTERTNFSNIRT